MILMWWRNPHLFTSKPRASGDDPGTRRGDWWASR